MVKIKFGRESYQKRLNVNLKLNLILMCLKLFQRENYQKYLNANLKLNLIRCGFNFLKKAS